MTKKNAKKETRHLALPGAASSDAKTTICGRPIGKVVLWAKKTAPDENDGVCRRCMTLGSGRAPAVKGVKPESQKSGNPESRKAGKRQPALLILGDRMPNAIEVMFKGIQTVAKVNADGTIDVPLDEGIQKFNSPSRAGKAIANREIDGWHFWSTPLANGTLVKLDALRKAVVA